MLQLNTKSKCEIFIKPRFPAKSVHIDLDVLEILIDIQKALPHNTRLVLTRGYENPRGVLGLTRSILRLFGIIIFFFMYPRRTKEIFEIFTANGHNQNGKHVDISIMVNGEKINLLPYGVFTPLSIIKKSEDTFKTTISQIEKNLETFGGRLHKNRLERLQIHVDFI